nr:hypothetical protein [Endozoicomonas sp.]
FCTGLCFGIAMNSFSSNEHNCPDDYITSLDHLLDRFAVLMDGSPSIYNKNSTGKTAPVVTQPKTNKNH